MRKVTENYMVYKFDELPEDIQDKAVERHSDINIDHEWWDGDYHLGLTADEMKSRHIKLSDNWWESDKPKDSRGNIIGEYPAHTGLFSWDDIYFDLDRNRYIQFKCLDVNDDNIFRKYLRVPKALWENCSYNFTMPSHGGFYGESSSRLEIEADFWDGRDFTEKQQEVVDRAMELMNDKIDGVLSDLIKEYEHQTSREGIIDTIKANDYDFTDDGKIAPIIYRIFDGEAVPVEVAGKPVIEVTEEAIITA